MSSIEMTQMPHAVCIPYPAQGHINPMLNLAKLLHHRGFHVTFVNTEYNHSRLLRSRGPSSLDGLPSFQFHAIPDGLPPSDADATQDIPALCQSTQKSCSPYFRDLLERLNEESATSGSPPVSCVVSDGAMSFTLDAAEAVGVPEVLFWTTSACGFMGYVHYRSLIDRGLTPLKDASYLTNGYLDTVVDWIPAKRASAMVFNTFDRLEKEVLDALKSRFPPIYTLGPLHLPTEQLPDNDTRSIGSNLWKEDLGCLEWLDLEPPGSVVYVNFGSITVMSPTQLVEFAWGLANSGQTFLWVIRPDLVGAEPAGELVPPGASAKPPGGRRVPDPQRLELHNREHRGRRASGVLAVLCRAADELPVQPRGVGDRDGDRRRREEGGGGEAGEGADGGGEREGDEEEGDGVEGDGRRGHVPFRVVVLELGRVGQQGAALAQKRLSSFAHFF
ncbi:hypothetical protein EUGRSUZ_F00355 [Eucalyptus grandis]|uniref:Uncharacterized protein n=2 Tax=Eucalyptus grandis TaxID=71139 RepID=A0ACC3KAY4_EUCGR|nr:hypothetical protein EUGRSUZ_F00355 [Eucalyptus grandis]